MAKMSLTQARVLGNWQINEIKSAYSARCTLATLRAIVKIGILRDVTPNGPGGMFSPSTHYQFKRIK